MEETSPFAAWFSTQNSSIYQPFLHHSIREKRIVKEFNFITS